MVIFYDLPTFRNDESVIENHDGKVLSWLEEDGGDERAKLSVAVCTHVLCAGSGRFCESNSCKIRKAFPSRCTGPDRHLD